jgi:hypothetical protein
MDMMDSSQGTNPNTAGSADGVFRNRLVSVKILFLIVLVSNINVVGNA